MNILKIFCESLINYLTKTNGNSTKLIKFISQSGEIDLSFPISMKIFRNQVQGLSDVDIEKFNDNILFFAMDKHSDDLEDAKIALKSQSSTWIISIDDISIINNHCCIKLNRTQVFELSLRKLNENFGRLEKNELETVSIEIENQEDMSVTQHRVQIVEKVVRNLVKYSRFVQVDDPEIAKHKILVTSKSNPKKCEESMSNRKLILCGPVVDAKDNKISSTSSQDFIQLRMKDMHLIAIHKYGIRVKDDKSFHNLIQRLGESAAKLDLLEVKHSSALKLTGDPKKAFILYNSARMETLLEKFAEKEQEGYYEKLPKIEDIDFSHLKEDEEWDLMKLVLSFPDIIERAINDLPQGYVSIQILHKFLNSLVSIFSIYYRRVRLLTENRSQLMPSLYAKIHFLKLVRKIFNETLAIFDIQPVAFM